MTVYFRDGKPVMRGGQVGMHEDCCFCGCADIYSCMVNIPASVRLTFTGIEQRGGFHPVACASDTLSFVLPPLPFGFPPAPTEYGGNVSLGGCYDDEASSSFARFLLHGGPYAESCGFPECEAGLLRASFTLTHPGNFDCGLTVAGSASGHTNLYSDLCDPTNRWNCNEGRTIDATALFPLSVPILLTTGSNTCSFDNASLTVDVA